MEIVALDATTATLAHLGHRFVAALADCLPTADGQAVATPELACQDPGCAFACRCWLPLAGPTEAQRLFVHAQAAGGRYPSLPAAATAIARLLDGQGATRRFDPALP